MARRSVKLVVVVVGWAFLALAVGLIGVILAGSAGFLPRAASALPTTSTTVTLPCVDVTVDVTDPPPYVHFCPWP
jgi:hypothetical protein